MRLVFVSFALLLAACSSAADEQGDAGAPTTDALGSGESATSTTTELVQVNVDSLGADHVEPPVSYDESPSIGGDHFPFWQNCGFYEVEVIEGAATHTLEHGAVWITYNPTHMSEAELSALEGMAQNNGKLLISPYPHEESLVLTAWGVQLRTPFDPSAPQVQAFIDEWVDNPELSEAGVRCNGAAGVPPNDVRSLADGTQVPDEFR